VESPGREINVQTRIQQFLPFPLIDSAAEKVDQLQRSLGEIQPGKGNSCLGLKIRKVQGGQIPFLKFSPTPGYYVATTLVVRPAGSLAQTPFCIS
jgi:hypothetical protein